MCSLLHNPCLNLGKQDWRKLKWRHSLSFIQNTIFKARNSNSTHDFKLALHSSKSSLLSWFTSADFSAFWMSRIFSRLNDSLSNIFWYPYKQIKRQTLPLALARERKPLGKHECCKKAHRKFWLAKWFTISDLHNFRRKQGSWIVLNGERPGVLGRRQTSHPITFTVYLKKPMKRWLVLW